MSENLNDALLITVVGMGLVFGAILLLWLFMYVLVRYSEDAAETAEDQADTARDERKRRAAAIAVATALAIQERRDAERPHVPPLPPTAIVSAWQAVMRQNQLKQRGPR